jgi:hypothetical protein
LARPSAATNADQAQPAATIVASGTSRDHDKRQAQPLHRLDPAPCEPVTDKLRYSGGDGNCRGGHQVAGNRIQSPTPTAMDN